MGLGMHARVMVGRMDGDFFIQVLDDELQEIIAIPSKFPQDITV